MNLQTIEFEFSDEECQNGDATCPGCGKPWVKVENGDADVVERPECRHIKFFVDRDGDSIQCFSGFELEQLLRVAKPIARRLEPCCLDGDTIEAFIRDNCGEAELWSGIKSPALDT